jgi:hypothetical protein
MPQLIRSTLFNIHKIGLKIIGGLLILSMILVYIKVDVDYISIGNLRVIFWFVTIYINFKLLDKIKRTYSASIMMASCYLSFFIYPLLPVETNYAENLFLLPSTLIIFSVLPYLVFDLKSERLWIVFWVVILFVTFMISVKYSILNMDKVKYQGLIVVFTQYTMLAVAYFSSWIFIQIMFFRYLKNIEVQNVRIQEVNTLLDENVSMINDQNTVLDHQSRELIRLQDEIGSLNDKLELVVRERTAELEKQTEALNKYGFVNSQLVRGPIELIVKDKSLDFNGTDLNLELLNSIMQDLDSITYAISDVLNLQNLEGIKEVEKMIQIRYSKNEGI